MTKRIDFSRLPRNICIGTKQEEEDEILPTSDNKVEVSDDSVGHRLAAPSKRKKERGRVSYHKNLPASLSAGRRSLAGSRST